MKVYSENNNITANSYSAIDNKTNNSYNEAKTTIDVSEASVKNTDVFEIRSIQTESTGIYTKITVSNSNKIRTEASGAVQLPNTSSSSSTYLNVITQKAAQKAGVSIGANGAPRINSAAQSNAFSAELSRIRKTFWCQTAGWWTDGGGDRCAQTAIATCASINTGETVKPNQVLEECKGISGAVERDRINDSDASYVTYSNTCNKTGLKYYNFSSESDFLRAINNELSNNRSVVVKTTYDEVHWVTVTGTRDGQPAESFSDLIGVDPWFNGNNPNNASCASADDDAKIPALSGVIVLSNNANQTFHDDYAMFAIV